MKHFILMTFCLLQVTLGLAQETCLQQVRQAYTQLRSLYENEQDIWLDYQVSSFYKDGDVLRQVEQQLVWKRKKDKSLVESGKIIIFADKQHQVSLLKDQQMLLLMAAPTSEKANTSWQQFVNIQDSLLAKSKVVTCQKEKIQGANFQKIKLQPDAVLAQAYSIKEIELWIQPDKLQIKKVKLYYQEETALEAVEMQINQLRTNLQQEIFAGNALSQVMNQKGELLPAYQHFQLKDLR